MSTSKERVAKLRRLRKLLGLRRLTFEVYAPAGQHEELKLAGKVLLDQLINEVKRENNQSELEKSTQSK